MDNVSDPVVAYRTYGPALQRKAERILQSSDDAGDVVHSLFADLMRRKHKRWDLPYLYRAVTNRCLNHLRDRDNRTRLLAEQQATLRGPARIRCDDHVIGVELLTKLADKLDKRSLEILVCRFIDDMTQDEIAVHLRVSRKTVGKRLAAIRGHVDTLVGGEAQES